MRLLLARRLKFGDGPTLRAPINFFILGDCVLVFQQILLH